MEDGQSDKVFPKSKETKVLEARIRALTGETTSDKDVETLPNFLECFCLGKSTVTFSYHCVDRQHGTILFQPTLRRVLVAG